MGLTYPETAVRLTGQAGEAPGVDLSARHYLLLGCLLEHGGRMGLVELARAFAARTHGYQSSSIPDSVLRDYYLELGRTTIRHLEAEGLIEYCEDEGVVNSMVRTE